MSTKKHREPIFKPVHFQAALFLFVYFGLSSLIFSWFVSMGAGHMIFTGPFLYGLVTTFVFLYLFTHEDFFKFLKQIEKTEKKKEDKYLNKYLKYGKYAACLVIGQVGGSIFLALTIRLMFAKSKNKYWIAFVCVLINTIIAVALAKGLLSVFI